MPHQNTAERSPTRRNFLAGMAAGAVAPALADSTLSSAAAESISGDRLPARCGFGTAIVTETYHETRPFGKDLEARFLYLGDGESRWLLAAFDFSYFRRGTCQTLRAAFSQATGVPVSNIWIHATHNHAGASAREIDEAACQKLIERCLPAIRDAIQTAEPAEFRAVVADTEGRWNLQREQYIPGLGAVTMWHGWDYDPDGRGWTQDPKWMLLRGWHPNLPAFQEKIYFDRPADTLAPLLVFRSLQDHRVLGHLVRFSAHPVTFSAPGYAGNPQERRQHPDWPGYLREAIERDLGGLGVAVTGPCGDSVTKHRVQPTYEEADRECRRIAEGIARDCLRAYLAQASPWEPARLHAPVSQVVSPPLRETVPGSLAELDAVCEPRAAEAVRASEQAIASDTPAFQIKRLIDDAQHWGVMELLCTDWCDMTDEELARRQIDVELSAVRINDFVLAGWAGETMIDTTRWLQAQSYGQNLILIDEINGYTVYNMTPEQYQQGGYSYWCSFWSPEAEPALRKHALTLIQSAYQAI